MLFGVQGAAEQWSSEFAAHRGDDDWANQFAEGFADGINTDWMEEYAQDLDAQQAAAEAGNATGVPLVHLACVWQCWRWQGLYRASTLPVLSSRTCLKCPCLGACC